VAQRSGKVSVSLYEGKHFTGRKLEVFGDCGWGFMNRVNSIRVESGQFTLEHGDCPYFFHWNSHSDHTGCCRPVGMVSPPAGGTEGQPWADSGRE
uniref:Beta/gamma crystallin 'Greek key' domain-containing protein n=1 Tax=Cebus imitator TaxID=2715852 RepID=A0A2K5PNZ0_CEBIM